MKDIKTTTAAFKLWAEKSLVSNYVAIGRRVSFDPQKVIEQCNKASVIRAASWLGLKKECGQLGLDAVNLIAHLNEDPFIAPVLEAAQKVFNDNSRENKDALDAAQRKFSNRAQYSKREAMVRCAVGFACLQPADDILHIMEYVVCVVEGNQELINKLDELMHPFREIVYKALIAELEKPNAESKFCYFFKS